MATTHDDMPGVMASQAEIAQWLAATYPRLHAEAIKHLVRIYRNRSFTKRIPGYTATALDVLAAQIERHPNHLPVIRQVNTRPEEYLKAEINPHGRLIIENDEYRLSCAEESIKVRAVGDAGVCPTSARGIAVREILARQVLNGLNARANEIYEKQHIQRVVIHALTPDDIIFEYDAGAYHDAWLTIPKITGTRRHSLANCYDCSNGALTLMAEEISAQFANYIAYDQVHAMGLELSQQCQMGETCETVITYDKTGMVLTELRTATQGTLLGMTACFDSVKTGSFKIIPASMMFAIKNVVECYGQDTLECEAWLIKALAHQNTSPWERATRIIERKIDKGRADASKDWCDDIANDRGTIDRAEVKFDNGTIVYSARCWLADKIEITGSRINLRGHNFSDAVLDGLVGRHVTDLIDHPFLEGYTIKSTQTLNSKTSGQRLVIYLDSQPKTHRRRPVKCAPTAK